MTVRKVTFYSDGIRLAGLVHLPEGMALGEKRPAILVCHGRVAIKEWVPSRWIPHLLAAGYVCMSFDYRNLGESDGKLGEIIPQNEVRDVIAATTMLQQQPEVDADRIGALGWGLGGGVAVAAAARDPRLKLVVFASGIAHGGKYGRVSLDDTAWEARQCEIAQDRIDRVMTGVSRSIPRAELVRDPVAPQAGVVHRQGWIESLIAAVGAERAADPVKLGLPDEITLESMEALYSFAPEDEVHLIAPRPVLVVHAKDDKGFPFAHAQALYDKAGQPKTLIAVEDAGHLDWIDPAFESQKIYVPKVVAWITEQLPVG